MNIFTEALGGGLTWWRNGDRTYIYGGPRQYGFDEFPVARDLNDMYLVIDKLLDHTLRPLPPESRPTYRTLVLVTALRDDNLTHRRNGFAVSELSPTRAISSPASSRTWR